jgi:integrase
MVERQLPKLHTRVRFPSPAPKHRPKTPLAEVTAPMLLQTLRRVEARGVRETVYSICQSCGQVFRYGVATGCCERNPASDLRGALRPVLVKHMAAIVEPEGFGLLLRAITDYQGSLVTRTALQLSALTFQRPGNVRAMQWANLQLEGASTWTIPAAEMKRNRYGKENGRPHVVPLARQAVNLLREIQPLTGHGKYVFPSLHGQARCMSENTINVALRRLGYEKDVHSAHGFRSSARTLIVERLNLAPDVVEAQLAHMKSGPLGSAYDRAEFLQQRRDMMQAWADYCDALRDGSRTVRRGRRAHVHISVRAESKHGKRLNPRKASASLARDLRGKAARLGHRRRGDASGERGVPQLRSLVASARSGGRAVAHGPPEPEGRRGGAGEPIAGRRRLGPCCCSPRVVDRPQGP